MDRAQIMANAFEDELKKIASAKTKQAGKILPALVAGAAGWEILRRMNQDRKMGRAMRAQQSQGF